MELLLENPWTWLGILFCLSQSAMFSGLNLAYFSLSRLRLETEVAVGNERAVRVLAKRRDANFLLTTLLWGNVGINVLLTLLTDSILSGVSAFFFSTVGITLVGEITPQAYFSRHALRMASWLSPVISVYELVLYPVAKPVALVLDAMLGREGILYFREVNLREIIKKHIDARGSEIDRIEGIGALNFLSIDDMTVQQEGETVDPLSVIALPSRDGELTIPSYQPVPSDPFLRKIQASGHKWVVFVDGDDRPRWVLDADRFLREVFFRQEPIDVRRYCHRPAVIDRPDQPLGGVLKRLRDDEKPAEIAEQDIVLLWGENRRVITGSDVLGRLLQGI